MKVYAEVQFGGWVEVLKAAPLRASGGIYGGGTENIVTDEIYSVASDERSSAFKKNVCDTLTHHDHFRSPVINAPQETMPNTAGTLVAGYAKCYNDNPFERGYAVRQQYAVRRLMPIECERLQGLPDNYTFLPGEKSCSDSARYKALGNGMAQPCADFVIRRIVEEVEKERTE